MYKRIKTLLLLLFTLSSISCIKNKVNTLSQNYFEIGSDQYPLSNAYYSIDSSNGFTALILTSSGLTYSPINNDLLGTGNLIEFDINDISSSLKVGNYYNQSGFYSGISLNYSATSVGNEYEINDAIPASLNISKSGSIYSIEFKYTLTTGQLVKGQFTGTILKTNL